MKDNQGIGKVSTVIVLALSIILAVGLASAVSSFFFFNFSQDGTILPISAYVNNVFFANNSWINWGNMNGGIAETVNFSVYNAGNIALNMSIVTNDLPSSWTETWTSNNNDMNKTFAMPQLWLNGTLTLTPPFDALAGYYSWNTTLLAQ